jgi:hypothetical protein
VPFGKDQRTGTQRISFDDCFSVAARWIDRCRSSAIGCDRTAKSAISNEGRELFRKLAGQWRALAEQIEFLNRLDQTAY